MLKMRSKQWTGGFSMGGSSVFRWPATEGPRAPIVVIVAVTAGAGLDLAHAIVVVRAPGADLAVGGVPIRAHAHDRTANHHVDDTHAHVALSIRAPSLSAAAVAVASHVVTVGIEGRTAWERKRGDNSLTGDSLLMNIAKIFKELCNTLYFQQEPFSPRAPLHAANTGKWIKMSEIKRPSVPASPV